MSEIDIPGIDIDIPGINIPGINIPGIGPSTKPDDSTPETQAPAPETQAPAPETQAPAPETQAPAPETQPAAPETEPSAPVESKPEATKPVEDEKVPEPTVDKNDPGNEKDGNNGGNRGDTGDNVFVLNEGELTGGGSPDTQSNPDDTEATEATEETEAKGLLGFIGRSKEDSEPGTEQPWGGSGSGGSFLMIGGILLVLILAACAVVMYIRKNEQKKRRRARRNNRTAVAAAAPAAAHTAAPMAAGYAKAPVAAAAYQHVGAREDQQDSYGVSRPELYGRQGVMAVVADGMGGLANGKAVSSALVRTYLDGFPQVSGYYEQTSDILLDLAIRSNAQVNKMLQGAERSGSTLVATMIRGGYLHFLTVGDSRVYLCRGGALIQLNREHIYQEELAAKAVNQSVAMNQVRTDRQAHSLTSYFGIGRIPSIDRNDEGLKLVPGDRILLASDGVFGTLTQEQMEQALQHEINEAAQLMGDMILNADKPYQDNNTLVILEYNG